MAYKVTNGRKNKIYSAILFGFLALFIFFISSKTFMFDADPIVQTKINESVPGLTNTNIILRKWVYDPEKNLMEVRIEADETIDNSLNSSFTFKAKEKDNLEELPVKVVYHNDQIYVVWIKNIPKNFKRINLMVGEKTKSSPSLDEQQVTKNNNGSDEMAVLYCDYRTVKKAHLEKKQKHEYALEILKMNIQLQEKEIEKLEKKIALQDDIKTQLLKEIDKIEGEQMYQTESEKQQSDADIQSKRNSILEVETKKQDLMNQLNEAREKEILLQKQLEDEQSKYTFGS